ncbi:hypothetical protein ANN_15001 [Periplaneta americana]|uniref:U6 snRNA-associated Sm-like protein LSm8 n=1 Tax=Periplaneta americana TaxID=6978 RepID=A0ABQ8SXU7_PERAM|nr:hypothetical protein ANN_15001 [Periplaneta americana]
MDDHPTRMEGTLKGFDQTINLILDESHERVYSTNQGVEQVVLGLHIIRGDNVLFSVDEIGDSEMVFGEMRPRICHGLPGIHLMVGENLGKNPTSAIVGELDENLDSRLDLSSIRADPLNHVLH